MVYGRYHDIVNGDYFMVYNFMVYIPTYNWRGGPSCTYHTLFTIHDLGVSENRLNPIVPNGFADHYPYEKWLVHWEY